MEGLVAMQLQVELLVIVKVDVPELMESIIVLDALVPFDTALTVTEAGETISDCARAVAKEPRAPSIATAAMELNLRKLLKLISTVSSQVNSGSLQVQLASHEMPTDDRPLS